jgi:hypothetical protein
MSRSQTGSVTHTTWESQHVSVAVLLEARQTVLVCACEGEVVAYRVSRFAIAGSARSVLSKLATSKDGSTRHCSRYQTR